jgi:hypothetical protein
LKIFSNSRQGFAFAATDEIKLGYSTTIAGSFTIKIDQSDALFFRSKCFIEDKFNNNC